MVLGSALYLSSVAPAPRVLFGEARFPDYSAGQPGINAANEVGIRLTLVTRDPWIQGQPQELTATVDAEPGPGVAAVDLTTLILYLERPASHRPTTVASDLVLLGPIGSNRWISRDGPLRIFPNGDVVGADLFLGFSLSLNVDYSNGQSYGFGGWQPGVRIDAPDIAPNLAPYGLLLLAAGAGCGVLAATAWTSRRTGTRIAERGPRTG